MTVNSSDNVSFQTNFNWTISLHDLQLKLEIFFFRKSWSRSLIGKVLRNHWESAWENTGGHYIHIILHKLLYIIVCIALRLIVVVYCVYFPCFDWLGRNTRLSDSGNCLFSPKVSNLKLVVQKRPLKNIQLTRWWWYLLDPGYE